IRDQTVASTVTAYGRESIQKCETFFKSNDFLVLYGDTDSVFVHCKKNENNSVNFDYGHELASKFHEWSKSDFPKLEMEDIFKTLIMISKKCYVGQKSNGQYKIVGFQKKVPACISKFTADIIDFIFDEKQCNLQN